MNLFSLMLEALVKRGGYFLALWLIPIFAVAALYRSYDVELNNYELGGMAFVYGALLLAGIQAYQLLKAGAHTKAAATKPKQSKTARRRRKK